MACVAITAQSNYGQARDASHFATMNRAKRLEFDAVVVVAAGRVVGDGAAMRP
jgi:hypothetical protein